MLAPMAGRRCTQQPTNTLRLSRKKGLVPPQRIFGSLSILDIGTRSIPLDDLSLLIAQRHGADQKPAIFSIGAAQAHFIFVRFPGRHVRTPLFQDSWNVFGMNGARWLFDVLLQRNARVVQATL